jgi:hypothetical protein
LQPDIQQTGPVMRVYLQAVGLVAPGLPDWPSCRNILIGKHCYNPVPIMRFNPVNLPANQRRRITPTIRIALQAASEAMQSCSAGSEEVATVFASDSGDLEITDRICTALCQHERPVSPTDFHNSVHNAPAGYWTIGWHCHRPSTSISAGYACAASGLLEAASQALCNDYPVMLVVYDHTPPATLANSQTVTIPFAAALVIGCMRNTESLGMLTMTPTNRPAGQGLKNGGLEQIRNGNPAAQVLLLLELLAGDTHDHCVLPYLGGNGLLVDYMPCQ